MAAHRRAEILAATARNPGNSVVYKCQLFRTAASVEDKVKSDVVTIPRTAPIYIDGVDIRTVTQHSLRRQMAVVPQEVDLFSRTIHENIAYGSEDVDRQEVEYAARVSQAREFIQRCERGYDTNVGERGLALSGGERQRIGIARAILRDPRILVLDEATSHLDAESEQLIRNATDKIISGRTSFVIAHRLSTVENASLAVVFAEGGIEAVGRHQKLWDTSPMYRRLYSLQPVAYNKKDGKRHKV